MDNESTALLMRQLKSDGKNALEKHSGEYLDAQQNGFVTYIDALIAEKCMKRQDIFQRADIPQKYGYKLLTGESHTTDRDKLLRIFIAMQLTLKQAQHALALYGLPTLYPKLRRDAVIIIALNKGEGSVDTVNEWLREQGEPELARSGD